MSKKSFLKPFALAAVCAASPLSMTAAAESGVSANLGISNIYLWRGQDVSSGGAVVHGGLEYGHSSGFYTGIWGSSESGPSEYDLYLGFGTEAGDFSFDISYWSYLYPETPNAGPNDLAEVILDFGFAGVGFAAYLGVGDNNEDDHYFTLSYGYGSFGILVGTWAMDADDSDYTHLDITYAYNDNLSFGMSQIVADDDNSGVAGNDDPLFFVGYDFAF